MKLTEAKLKELIYEVLNESRFNKKVSSGTLGMLRGNKVSISYYKNWEKEKFKKSISETHNTNFDTQEDEI